MQQYAITGVYVWDYSKLKVSAVGAEDVVFTATATGDRDGFSVQKDGKTFEVERFRLFNSSLTAARIATKTFTAEKGDLLATIDIKTPYENYVVKYYKDKASEVNSVIEVNGQIYGTISTAYINMLVNNMNNIDTEAEIVTVW
jgi:hypothetical protein